MKTMRILSVMALTMAMGCVQSFAQTRYYQTEETYDLGNGVAYRTEMQFSGYVFLYNANSVYTLNSDQTFADGSPLPWEIADSFKTGVRYFTMTETSDPDIQNRVNSALTAAQKQIVGDRRLPIHVIVNPQTGEVIEVYFGFPTNSPYALLPPSAFHQIEQNFLSRPKIDGFVVTDIGRLLNYVTFSWGHEFK